MDSKKLDLLAQEIQNRCRGELKRDEPLSRHTTFGVGGPADLFFLPADLEDLVLALPLVRDTGLPILPLGGGTNTLAKDEGFRGLIICLTDGANRISFEPMLGRVQAGASLQVFSRHCQREGRSGIEFGCGIPGTVGGAIFGNAGAWGSETLDHLITLSGIHLASGEDLTIKVEDIDFGYRKTDLSSDLLVVEADFTLKEDDPKLIQRRMDRMLAERKASQPLSNRSSGCVFKNPPGTSAGLLIDESGNKGLTVGSIQVSTVHANFMVNLGGGNASDIFALIDKVKSRVRSSSGIDLETEVRIIGEQGIENS